MTLEELLAREEITDVVKRLARGTDRLDEVETLPHFDATMHFVSPPLIELDMDRARADTYCVAHHLTATSDMVLGLRYVDRFERRSGAWRIAKRVCAFDWTYSIPIDPDRTWPFGEDFTVGARDRTDITYRGV